MVNLGRNVSPMAVVLASLVLWVSFAWGLPAEPPATEGEAGVTREDVWAGVKISDAYDYAKCPECGKKKELRAERCSGFTWRGAGYRRCGTEFPQPSAEMTDPDMVFVPGLGYYREGTLLEPGKTKKGYWITGLVLTASGLAGGALAGYYGGEIGGAIAALPCLAAIGVGVGFIIYGLVARTEPVYAFTSGARFEPYERPAFALSSTDSDGGALKVEVTLWGF